MGLDSPKPPNLDFLEAKEKQDAIDALYEVLLVLADATAWTRPGPKQADQRTRAAAALRVLDRAKEIAPPSPALYQRRARFLEVLGEKKKAADAARQAAAPPVKALELVPGGIRPLDRG